MVKTFLLLLTSAALGVSLDETGQALKSYKFHNNPEARYLQKLDPYFLYHHTVAAADGEGVGERDFSGHTEESRRFWFGLSGQYLHHFTFKAVANIGRDRREQGGEIGFGLENFRGLRTVLDAKSAFSLEGVDKLEIGYGRRSVPLIDQWHRSASVLSTLERNAFSNKLWPRDEDNSNALMTWVKWTQGIHSFDVALISTDEEAWLPSWDEGLAYTANWKVDLAESSSLDQKEYFLAAFYQDAQDNVEQLGNGVRWSGAAVNRIGKGDWRLNSSIGYGENSDYSDFWGVTVQPMLWLKKDKVKAVLQYQYQASDAPNGISLNRRYARQIAANEGIDINKGKGDANHSYYAGLNYYFSGETIKLISGLQYDHLSSRGEKQFTGWTAGSSFQIYF